MTEAADNLWNQQILQHEAWLRTVVRSRLSTQDEADDVMQNVLAEAISHRHQTEVRAVGPWLYRLAVNAVLQFRRSCGRRRKLHDNYKSAGSIAQTAEPIETMLGLERQTIVQSALSGMSGEDVEILMLKYIHGWSYHQICEQLGLEHHRVAHRLRRARNRLKFHLQQHGISSGEVES